MTYSPQRRSNVALAVIGGFFATAVAELVIDLLLDFTVKSTSNSVGLLIVAVEGMVAGAVTGGVICLGRPRHYGVVPVAAIGSVVMSIAGDEVARPIIAVLHHEPISLALFTSYFTISSLIYWVLFFAPVLTSGGITATRVGTVRRAEARAAQAPFPARPPYGPAPQPMPPHPLGGPPGPPPQPPWRPTS